MVEDMWSSICHSHKDKPFFDLIEIHDLFKTQNKMD